MKALRHRMMKAAKCFLALLFTQNHVIAHTMNVNGLYCWLGNGKMRK